MQVSNLSLSYLMGMHRNGELWSLSLALQLNPAHQALLAMLTQRIRRKAVKTLTNRSMPAHLLPCGLWM